MITQVPNVFLQNAYYRYDSKDFFIYILFVLEDEVREKTYIVECI